jgi:hypothetical protein
MQNGRGQRAHARVVRARPGEERARLWDSKLPGFGVTVGRRRSRSSSSAASRARDAEARDARPLGAEQAARAGCRASADRTMTVQMARGGGDQGAGQMRGGADPRGEEAPAAREEARARRGPDPGRSDRPAPGLLGKRRREPAHARAHSYETDATSADWKRSTRRLVAQITRTDCRERHDRITRDAGPYAANRVMRHLRAVYNTCLKEHDLPGEPDDRRALEQGAAAPGADPVGEAARVVGGRDEAEVVGAARLPAVRRC